MPLLTVLSSAWTAAFWLGSSHCVGRGSAAGQVEDETVSFSGLVAMPLASLCVPTWAKAEATIAFKDGGHSGLPMPPGAEGADADAGEAAFSPIAAVMVPAAPSVSTDVVVREGGSWDCRRSIGSYEMTRSNLEALGQTPTGSLGTPLTVKQTEGCQ